VRNVIPRYGEGWGSAPLVDAHQPVEVGARVEGVVELVPVGAAGQPLAEPAVADQPGAGEEVEVAGDLGQVILGDLADSVGGLGPLALLGRPDQAVLAPDGADVPAVPRGVVQPELDGRPSLVAVGGLHDAHGAVEVAVAGGLGPAGPGRGGHEVQRGRDT
jgi:hypothetical protein